MQGVESNTTTHLSHAIVKASSLEPSPREYGAGGTYFPRSYSYNMPATDDAVAEHQGLGLQEPASSHSGTGEHSHWTLDSAYTRGTRAGHHAPPAFHKRAALALCRQ